MNRNDVGKNFINVNLCIKTKMIVGVGATQPPAQLGAKQLICGEDKNQTTPVHLFIDWRTWLPKRSILQCRAQTTHKRVPTLAKLKVEGRICHAVFAVRFLKPEVIFTPKWSHSKICLKIAWCNNCCLLLLAFGNQIRTLTKENNIFVLHSKEIERKRMKIIINSLNSAYTSRTTIQ